MTGKITKPAAKELTDKDLEKVTGASGQSYSPGRFALDLDGESSGVKDNIQNSTTEKSGEIVAADFDNKAQR